MWSPKAVMLENDLRNTAEIGAAIFAKAVIKYQGTQTFSFKQVFQTEPPMI